MHRRVVSHPITYPYLYEYLNRGSIRCGLELPEIKMIRDTEIHNLLSVTRNQDNQAIPLDNAWLSFVTIPDTRVPVYEHKFHFVDVFADTLPKTYTVVWSPKDPTPPYVDTIGALGWVSAAKSKSAHSSFQRGDSGQHLYH